LEGSGLGFTVTAINDHFAVAFWQAAFFSGGLGGRPATGGKDQGSQNEQARQGQKQGLLVHFLSPSFELGVTDSMVFERVSVKALS